ncbi:MAG: DUF5700 domain-containing putative Zn-dependent protease [Bacteriovoracaceae bacterium]|nr:hypothetical protein [Bacteroidota bacterium]
MNFRRIEYRTVFIITLMFQSLSAQDHFNIALRLDFSSIDALLELSEGRIANVNRVAELRGNQIAAATSALLAREQYSTQRFAQELERYRSGSTMANDMFGLNSALRYREQIKALSLEAKRRNLDRKVLATIAPFFPEQIRINASIPVYFVALGNENAAAFVRSIVWRDNIPYFVGEGEGELTIVVNLTRSVQYIQEIQIQFVDMMSTLAHETFHAVFGIYQQQTPTWKEISSKPEPYWMLAELVQNEGIAYLISLQQRTGSHLSAGQLSSSKQSIVDLNSALKELSSPSLTQIRARELIMNSNLSGSYEKNYGASAGLLMAYAIDAKLGRKALTESLDYGVGDFFGKYQQLAEQFGELPKLDTEVIKLFQQ